MREDGPEVERPTFSPRISRVEIDRWRREAAARKNNTGRTLKEIWQWLLAITQDEEGRDILRNAIYDLDERDKMS